MVRELIWKGLVTMDGNNKPKIKDTVKHGGIQEYRKTKHKQNVRDTLTTRSFPYNTE